MKFQNRSLVLATKRFQKVQDQRFDIVLSTSKWWQPNRNHIQTPVQIFAKTAFLDLFFQITIAGGHDANIYRNGLGRTHPFKFTILQHAQQFDLQRGTGGIDLIEKNSAFVSSLKPTGPGFVSVGKSSFDVSKQLAIQKRLSQRATIDADKRTGCPITQIVNRRSNQLLTSTRFAQ